MRVTARAIVLAVGLALAAAACDSASTTTPAPTQPTASQAASQPATGAATAVPSSAPMTRAPLGLDPALLEVLPADIAGFPVERSPDVEAADAADPTIPAEVDGLAAAFVHDDDLANWAVVTVVELQPGVLSDGFLRSWRQSFDEGACEPAGGVTGTASSTIGGREVEIGRCVEGVNTYHVRLSGDRIVSITAVGPERYGEQLVAGITE